MKESVFEFIGSTSIIVARGVPQKSLKINIILRGTKDAELAEAYIFAYKEESKTNTHSNPGQ